MERLEEQVVDTTTTIIIKFQLSIPTEHNVGTYLFPACHIFQPSKLNLSVIRQDGILQLSPWNQSIKCANMFRKINPHGNGTPRSRAR